MKKLTLAAIAAVSLIAFATVRAEDKPAASTKDYVILKINGEEVKKSEAEAFFKAMFGSAFGAADVPSFDHFDDGMKRNILRGLATERLLGDEAQKEGFDTRPDVQEKLKLAKQQIMVQALVQEKTKTGLTDDQLKAEYAKRAKDMGDKEEIHARHILVKTEAEANAVYQQLSKAKGANFDKLAKEKSDDKGSGAKGGDLGWFTADRMVPEFSKAAFALKKGEISKPVKSDFGWHVIQVLDRRKAAAPPFEQVKEQLKQDMGNKIMQAYVIDLVKKADVKFVTPDGKEEPLAMDQKQPAPAKAAEQK